MQSTFHTDREWPRFIREQFLNMNTVQGEGSRYYGAYNSLLIYVFGDPTKYSISPDTSVTRVHNGRVETCILCTVYTMTGTIVMILEANNHHQVLDVTAKYLADERMRKALNTMQYRSTIGKICGISALKNLLHVYIYDPLTHELRPERVANTQADALMVEGFMTDSWNEDVMSRKMFRLFKDFRATIDAMYSDGADLTPPASVLQLPISNARLSPGSNYVPRNR